MSARRLIVGVVCALLIAGAAYAVYFVWRFASVLERLG